MNFLVPTFYQSISYSGSDCLKNVAFWNASFFAAKLAGKTTAIQKCHLFIGNVNWL